MWRFVCAHCQHSIGTDHAGDALFPCGIPPNHILAPEWQEYIKTLETSNLVQAYGCNNCGFMAPIPNTASKDFHGQVFCPKCESLVVTVEAKN